MQQTMKLPGTGALCVLAAAWVCAACDAPSAGFDQPALAAQTTVQSADADQARRAAQAQLDDLHLRMAAVRERLQRLAPQQREPLVQELDALDALWRQTQRALVASGMGDRATSLNTPPTNPQQESAPWKKSG